MKDSIAFRTLRSLLFAVGCAFAMASAVAQQTEVVVVEAIRAVTVEKTSSGIPIKEVTLKRTVNYADLDLATPSGAQVLEQRIRQTAKSACQELDQKYPNTVPNPGKDCFEGAVDGAMAEGQKLIDAAKGKPSSK
jgi:UrcA family protein